MENLRGEGLDLAGDDPVGSENNRDYSLSDSFEQANDRHGLGLFDGVSQAVFWDGLELKVVSRGLKPLKLLPSTANI